MLVILSGGREGKISPCTRRESLSFVMISLPFCASFHCNVFSNLSTVALMTESATISVHIMLKKKLKRKRFRSGNVLIYHRAELIFYKQLYINKIETKLAF